MAQHASFATVAVTTQIRRTNYTSKEEGNKNFVVFDGHTVRPHGPAVYVHNVV